MGLESRLYEVIFASGDNPMSTINFGDDRGINLFEEFSNEKKVFDPKVIPEWWKDSNDVLVTQGFSDFDKFHSAYGKKIESKLPVLIGGKNGSGKTSFLAGIKIICDLLQNKSISRKASLDAWKKLKSMNISYIQCIFSASIPELSNADEYLFCDSITSIVMNSDDPDKQLKWCDGINIYSLNYNISERDYYHSYGEFGGKSKINRLPKYKTSIGKSRIKKFLDRLTVENDGVSKSRPHERSIFFNKVTEISHKFTQIEYVQQQIIFQKAEMLDVDRSGIEKELEWVAEVLPDITGMYEQFIHNSSVVKREMGKFSLEEWFSIIYGPSKNIIEQNESGEWDMVMWAPDIIENLQKPYGGWDVTPDWFRPRGGWKDKKDAMEFVTIAALLDITSWLTGEPQLEKTFISSNKGLTWVEIDDNDDFPNRHEIREYEQNKGIRKSPSLHEALKNPVVSKLLGINQNEQDEVRMDTLLRMNIFTPIEEITTSYLTSGQRQILALIVAVRKSPQGSLILIDEPELSLHVDWQNSLIEQLHSPLTGSQLVVATHSPDITMRHLHLCSILSTERKRGDL